MVENGEVGEDHGQRRLSHPDIGGDGRLCERISDGPSRSRCWRWQQVSQARGRGRVSGLPWHDGHSNRGVSLGGLPHGSSCRLGPPSEGALCGGQPTGMVCRSTGCRSCPRLKGLHGGQTSRALPSLAERKRERASSRHTKKAKTEVSSDTYLLQGKANRARGEAPRAPISAGAAEGCPATGFGAASTSGTRGVEGAACPGVVLTAEGPTSCIASTGTCSWGTGGSA
jgi:hypothetical protein